MSGELKTKAANNQPAATMMKEETESSMSGGDLERTQMGSSEGSGSARNDPNNSSNLVLAAVSNVTSTTKKIVNKSTEKTKSIVQDMNDKAGNVVATSKTTIEKSKFLLPLKYFIMHFPRTNAIVWVVILLWFLILVSMGFGILLAQAESPQEIDGNDAIIAARRTIAYFRISDTALLNITDQCLTQWDQDGDLFVGEGAIAQVNRTRLAESLEECAASYFPEIQQYSNASEEFSGTASESLSFNWNRCWQFTGQRQLIFAPTDDMIEAARPDSQAEYFEEEWDRTQQELYQKYLPANATEEEQEEAFSRSVEEATGANTCEENMGGTAWFFFTIITTVGYGNQAPVTSDGRLIVVAAGLLGLIFFGAVLGLCGYVTVSIFDDAVGRTPFKCILQNPFFGMIFWGSVWLLYALALGQDFDCTSTIGLGDYYLQPEIVFASDTLKYSVLFLIGFVFLSSFFGKIAATLAFIMPQQHNSLEYRLEKTRVLACWPWGWMPWEARIKKKREEEGLEEDDDADLASDSPDDQAFKEAAP
ncbi:MAG: hypothetical protein SGARI_003567 [Bacillariaceae sp.]